MRRRLAVATSGSPWTRPAALLLLVTCACSGAGEPRDAGPVLTPDADAFDAGLVRDADPSDATDEDFPLAAFDFTLQGRHAAGQVDFLAQLGYAGIAVSVANPEHVASIVESAARHGEGFRFVTALWWLDVNQPVDHDGLSRLLPAVARGQGFLWVAVGPGNWPAEQPAPPGTIDKLRSVADQAREHGVPIVLYPHAGTPLTTADDALLWLRQIGRDNVRISLHLCHELKAMNVDELPAIIARVSPFVGAVSVNGADREVEPVDSWARTIQPLDRGSLDVNGAFVKPLRRAGYRGPVILHTFGIADPPDDHFRRSMTTWRSWAAGP